MEKFTFLDAIKNTSELWKEVKTSTLTGVWKKLLAALTDDLEGFKTSVEEVTADVGEIPRELELKVEPEDGTELPQGQEKTGTGEELASYGSAQWSLETESTSGEDAVKIVEMTTKDLVYSTPNLGGLWDHWKFENIILGFLSSLGDSKVRV